MTSEDRPRLMFSWRLGGMAAIVPNASTHEQDEEDPSGDATATTRAGASCIACDDTPTEWMVAQGYTCSGWRWAQQTLCNRSDAWRAAATCERSCSGSGYGGAYQLAPCCPPPPRRATPLGHSGEHTYEHTERAVYDRIVERFRSLERKLLSLDSFQLRNIDADGSTLSADDLSRGATAPARPGPVRQPVVDPASVVDPARRASGPTQRKPQF